MKNQMKNIKESTLKQDRDKVKLLCDRDEAIHLIASYSRL